MKLLTLLMTTLLAFSPLAWANLETDLSKAEFVDKQFIQAEIEAVKRVSHQWAERFNSHSPIQVAALYGDSFILYATFKTKIETPQALVDYFVNLMKKKDVKVVFNEQNIRVHGSGAVDSGLYTFSYLDEKGKKVEVPARYTFVFELSTDGWKIVDHHSSVLPE